ncbi:unnamed protein product [Miscanthus lutarioriparius]|uniref:Uncharacterized protein n=1 Tax=Miscanthus lutarioriparius TaxID=422564 RepID=A0A811QFL6_9POAL|nr:unnamed protein product [Miscanthus lutarioriparius]
MRAWQQLGQAGARVDASESDAGEDGQRRRGRLATAKTWADPGRRRCGRAWRPGGSRVALERWPSCQLPRSRPRQPWCPWPRSLPPAARRPRTTAPPAVATSRSSSEVEYSLRRLRPIRTSGGVGPASVAPAEKQQPAPPGTARRARKPSAAPASGDCRSCRPASPGARLASLLNAIFSGKQLEEGSDDGEESSDASSDLFELENLAALAPANSSSGCRRTCEDKLPVYGTTGAGLAHDIGFVRRRPFGYVSHGRSC